MYETKVGSVAIEVVSGDITKETSDVIVNSSNENFSLKSGERQWGLESFTHLDPASFLRF